MSNRGSSSKNSTGPETVWPYSPASSILTGPKSQQGRQGSQYGAFTRNTLQSNGNSQGLRPQSGMQQHAVQQSAGQQHGGQQYGGQQHGGHQHGGQQHGGQQHGGQQHGGQQHGGQQHGGQQHGGQQHGGQQHGGQQHGGQQHGGRQYTEAQWRGQQNLRQSYSGQQQAAQLGQQTDHVPTGYFRVDRPWGGVGTAHDAALVMGQGSSRANRMEYFQEETIREQPWNNIAYVSASSYQGGVPTSAVRQQSSGGKSAATKSSKR